MVRGVVAQAEIMLAPEEQVVEMVRLIQAVVVEQQVTMAALLVLVVMVVPVLLSFLCQPATFQIPIAMQQLLRLEAIK